MKKDKHKIKRSDMTDTHSASGMPETAEDMVNFYGTYEIQPTADTENQYPAIAQGYNKKQTKHDCENPDK